MEHRQIDLGKQSAKQAENLSQGCVRALRSNIARHPTGTKHRGFCIRLADSPLLQWFLQIGGVDGVTAFTKSTGSRFAHCTDEAGLQAINARLIALLNNDRGGVALGLAKPISFDDVYFGSVCFTMCHPFSRFSQFPRNQSFIIPWSLG